MESLASKKLEKFKTEEKKKGVIYISRVPPFMKPEKLRHIMEQWGEIGRIYLTPEDKTNRNKRVKSGGNKKVKYTDGWVEFFDKSIAKSVALTLNGTTIGGKKRHNFFRDDIWTMKYLPKFKWHHLTDQIAHANRVRDQKLKTEVAQAKRENQFYLDKVEQAKQISKMEEKRKRKREGEMDAEEDATVEKRIRRSFMQRTEVVDETQ
eukprot:GILJ01001088.1.p1 GENE.GILJ01001088.1~~GILJ01001088.1.p1  ORF type:complete len:207 (-),score=40.09 GILJ01001088.1:429-1049(-)